jgi:hypothetical protein
VAQLLGFDRRCDMAAELGGSEIVEGPGIAESNNEPYLVLGPWIESK